MATPAFAGDHGRAEAAGLALSALAVGSAVGGLIYGGRRWAAAAADRYAYGFAALGVALSLLAIAASVPALAALMFVAGLGVAPLSATAFGLIDDVAPTGMATEAAGWIVTSYTLGAGLGALIAGVTSKALGPELAFLAVSASAFAGATAIWLRRRTLERPTPSAVVSGGHLRPLGG